MSNVEDTENVQEKVRRLDNGIGKVVAEHYNKLEERGLEQRKESRIFFMRNFNNWIKSQLIQDYSSKLDAANNRSQLNVLDIGCGKGGDLIKWSKCNTRHVVGLDIADTSIQQCKERYQVMKDRNRGRPLFTSEFYPVDCTKTDTRSLYSDPDIKFDIASCQFAFHYCFESYQQATTMMNNICQNLRVGGFFIGTTPCSYEIMSRLQKSGGDEFGNSVYKVSFDSDSASQSPALFGAQYNFHLEGVVDCPEFLVYFPVLEKIADRFGLILVAKERFGNYFHKKQKPESEAVKLLKKMSALEPYPSDKLVAQSEQYKHAQSQLREGEGRGSIGTLSSDEWEALNIYTIFAFKKIREP